MSIRSELIQSIESFLKYNSNIASNRVIRLKDNNNQYDYMPVRYLEDNQLEMWKKFPYNDKISKTTFLKYLNINNQYKKPCRLTDLCDYCVWAKDCDQEIRRIINSIENFEFHERFDPENLIKYFLSKKKEAQSLEKINEFEKIIQKLEKYEIVLGHQEIAKIQRDSYNLQRKSKLILEKNILIEIDYKQKISIGLSPIQKSSEYYKQELRTCLGLFKYRY